MQIAIISDTHMPRGARRLPDACVARLKTADHIIHAGDLMALSVLAELQALGPPVTAVYGNVDDAQVRAAIPAQAVLDLEGACVAVIHDAGTAKRRLQRMQARFPTAQAVIFGHSHIPLHETGPDGFQIFNPGSPTEKRRARTHTMGLAHVLDGRIAFELIEL